ncbi:MAG: DUF115 domain-containing protein [Oscillospiraceae bacterium]|nr:DUF115 domain-containing protein [Oscillospiraceae bacterium]
MFLSLKDIHELRNSIRNEYRIRRFIRENPEIKGLLSPNKLFRDKYKGQRCFVLGNGPSLKNVDFSLLQDEIVFTVNQLPRNKEYEKLKSNFHFWADERFFNIDETKPEDLELLDVMKSVNTPGNKPVVFYEYCAKQMIEKYDLDKVLDIHYFALVHLDFDAYTKRHKIEVDKCFPNLPTVVHSIIAMAVDMGFSEIILLGCDCTGFITTAQAKMKNWNNDILYGYKISENEKKRLEKSNNMFSIENELRFYANIFATYSKLNKLAEKNGVKIYNATEGGLLDCIPRVDYNSLFNKND